MAYLLNSALEGHWQQRAPSLFVLLILLYISWRLYRFTIIPCLRPQEAKELPYIIPFFGHASSFFTDTDALLTYARKYFKDTREPFVIVIAGERLHVATSAADVAVITKSPDFTFDSYMRDIMLDFHFTEPAVNRMWERPDAQNKEKEKENADVEGRFPNIGRKPLAKLAEDIIRRQLLPGSMFEGLQEDVLLRFMNVVSWDGVRDEAILQSTPTEKVVSLKKWTQQCLIGPATEAFFGTALLRVAPDLLDNFCTFDEKSWKLTYKVPTVFSKDMHAARRQAHESLIRYFDLPLSQRDDAAWVIKTVESEMRHLGIGTPDIAANLSMFYWVTNVNVWKVCFWALNFLARDPKLLSLIRDDVSPIITSYASSSPVKALQLLRQLPRYISFYNEVLRTVAAGKTIRDVTRPTVIGGKVMRPGDRVLISFRQMLVEEKVFGKDWAEFRPDRFVENDAPLKSDSFRPFGAGASLCSGRYFAMSEILFFMALVISRFNFEIAVEGDKAPELDISRSSLGIMPPKEGHDCHLRIGRRTDSELAN